MTSMLSLPSYSNAFSQYRPSTNAHVDFLIPSTKGKAAGSIDKSSVRVIKVSLPPVSGPSSKDELAILLDSIAPLLAGQPTRASYQQLSQICRRLVLCTDSKAPEIYDHIASELDRSVANLAREWRGSIMSREKDWLKRLTSGWKVWEKHVDLLASVFVYLDRVYSNEQNGRQSIKETAIKAFYQGIWTDVYLMKTKDELLGWAAAEREHDLPNTELRPTIKSLIELSSIVADEPSLVAPYMEQLIDHYTSVASLNITRVEEGTMSASKYVDWVLNKAADEVERARACLWRGTDAEVNPVVLKTAGHAMGDRVVRRALDEAMDFTSEKALARLYEFSVACDTFTLFVKALSDHIEARLRTLISDPDNDPKMIDSTLTLKKFTDKSIARLFVEPDGDTDMAEATTVSAVERIRQIELEDAIRRGFKAGMGSRQNAPAEWIAKHLDAAMRRGQGSGTEAQFNALLDEVIALIGFTKDKDVFKAFYSTQLAKRLLLSKSASDDMERNMIVKLQREMGEEFTSGDVMMKDLSLSETLVKAYQSAQAKNPDEFKHAGDFAANVLTESAWPAYPLLKDGWNFKLTPELQSSIDQFTSWYATQHKNRQLSWRWQLATVTLTARFPSGKYEIGVSLFQAVVLLQFNADDALDFNEIQQRTGIEKLELVRTVQSLSMGRKGTRVLVKKPAGKEVNPTDTFGWNKAFTSDRIKFRINQIQQDMSAEESRKTNEQVAVDRVSVLEATIVRIMKAKKKMTLQLLIDAVVTDVNKRFPPDIKEIKKRMESLIEREFLARDEDDRNLLHYLA
ncbi:putative ubiquitin-protein ligase [Kockovaella imperatae]|uniref:Putative ubiquitin-protein ligase n=1 Tax=Kockovaella imperatae TaxID=4999 RepID=A0A1Y1USH5_9TREE|nr:putative ubiquitin-protein ligase [Kockovaella imperatae]ORX40484.1 putative ubiquitin-protein ligase [Kockovaella imperatae]